MKLIKIDKTNYDKIDDLSCILGNFDGFHQGHKALLDSLLKMPNKKAVISFTPHPRSYFDKDNFKYIMNYDQKTETIKKSGIDYCIRLDFESFKDLSPMEFIDFLKNIGVKDITCGEDYRFSKGRAGTPDELSKHFNTTIIGEVKFNEIRISSTLIRNLISDGMLEIANELLGFNYKIIGEVIEGRQLGRTIGFPTANVEYASYILPKKGVYYGYVIHDDKRYKSMINIGNNPTMNHVDKLSLEAHIIDFDEDIYGKNISIEFVERLRNEIKFNGINELLGQLNKDKEDIINKKSKFEKELVSPLCRNNPVS